MLLLVFELQFPLSIYKLLETAFLLVLCPKKRSQMGFIEQVSSDRLSSITLAFLLADNKAIVLAKQGVSLALLQGRSLINIQQCRLN